MEPQKQFISLTEANMIFIKSPNNKTIAVDLNPETTTLSAIKHHIQSLFLIPLSSQRFLSPKPLLDIHNDSISNSLLLSHLGISPYSTLTLYIPFLGGTQEDEDESNQKFDEFEGNDVGLLASGDDDKEADVVWEEIDKRMESRRKDRRLKLGIKKYPDSNPKITNQFSDLKRKLSTLSAQDWDSIPEVGLRNKKKSRGPEADADISNTTKHRLLFKNLTRTNPKCPSGWIAAARLEEAAGKIQAARQLIQKGCGECPRNADVWLEACRLDDANQIRALEWGLEHIPDSVRLWKAVLELSSNEKEARRILLHRALECCPLELEFWLALARLETYDNAKKVLNRARMKLSKEPGVWIAAAKLEEANGNASMVGKIIERGIRALEREGLVIDKEAWMKEAEAAERAGSIATCQAIIKKTIGIGVEGEENRKRTWLTHAEECKKRGSIETARTILQEANAAIPNSQEIWLAAFMLEYENTQNNGTMMVKVAGKKDNAKNNGTMLDKVARKEDHAKNNGTMLYGSSYYIPIVNFRFQGFRIRFGFRIYVRSRKCRSGFRLRF